MTFDNDTNSARQSGTAQGNPYGQPAGDWFAWAKTPGFNPMKAVAVVAGLAVFPPLGVGALLYFMWTGRRHRGPWQGPAYAMGGGPRGHGCGWRHHNRGFTGNRVFDDYQAGVMRDLAAERDAFRAHREDQRRKRDQESFEAFRAAQASKPDGETPAA